jgi:hypothetical protein
MFKEVSELSLAQEDGGLPTAMAAGREAGENGVFVLSTRFDGAAHLSATPRRHHVCFQISQRSRFDCHIADQRLSHQPVAGSLAICPAGADYCADSEGRVDTILVAIDPRQFALAVMEDASPDAQLMVRLSGHDQSLLDLARTLVRESTDGCPSGPLFWSEVAARFIDRLITRHTSARQRTGDEWYLVHLPRLHPHLGQVAGGQECGAASNGSKKEATSASKMKFTRLLVIPTTSASSALC